MNKINITIIIAIIVTLPAVSFAQTGEISDVAIRKNGDRLDFSFTLRQDKTDPMMRYIYIPVVTGKSEEIRLSSTVFAGKKRKTADRRKKMDVSDYIIFKRRAGISHRYAASVPWEPWMDRVSVSMETLYHGCCHTTDGIYPDVVADKLLYYEATPHFDSRKLDYELTELERYDLENPFLHPYEDIAKCYDNLVNERENGSSTLHFKVGSHAIDREMPGNREVMEAILKAFDLIEADPNATLRKVMVAGYASPEGSLAFNTRLAQKRAESVRDFILANMKKGDASVFELYNGREDWDRLRDRVASSFMAERDQVLAIIDAYTMEEEIRKTRLKQLNAGVPYRYMLENFYPELRNAGYVQVYYEIDRKATVSTAVTDEQGRTTWIDPESPENIDITNINKAIDAMLQNDFDGALTLLSALGSDEKALNLIGVCHMMKGEYATARLYFERAVKAGDGDAEKNLHEISIIEQID